MLDSLVNYGGFGLTFRFREAALLGAMFVGAITLSACSGGSSGSPLQSFPSVSPSPGIKASDDWVTFAHDNLRTGFQSQQTGISPTTVSNLKLRWKISTPNGQPVYGAPLAYGGSIYVVTLSPATVYDFSAADGHTIWAMPIQGEVRATPTIDPDAGLLFVGGRIFDPILDYTLPSPFYAISTNTGAIVWTATLPITHSGPVVANGVVYVGTAGGDPPQCLNGGVTALDELTGSRKWTYYVNSQTNPGGGGSVWGPIAFDGSRLIFGTGNTCGSTEIPTANGAVAIDLNGKVLWNYTALKESSSDYDTGSSVMVSGTTATFKNKSCFLYTVDEATGTLERQVPIDQYYGYGQFPSPSTDGTTTVSAWGLNPISGPAAQYCSALQSSPSNAVRARASVRNATLAQAARGAKYVEQHTRRHPFDALGGYVSALVGIDNASGTILWTHNQMSSPNGVQPIVNGVVFAENDTELGAYNVRTGAILWSYPFASIPMSSPIVVPSGVYASDGGGNIYAFALPAP